MNTGWPTAYERKMYVDDALFGDVLWLMVHTYELKLGESVDILAMDWLLDIKQSYLGLSFRIQSFGMMFVPRYSGTLLHKRMICWDIHLPTRFTYDFMFLLLLHVQTCNGISNSLKENTMTYLCKLLDDLLRRWTEKEVHVENPSGGSEQECGIWL